MSLSTLLKKNHKNKRTSHTQITRLASLKSLSPKKPNVNHIQNSSFQKMFSSWSDGTAGFFKILM